MECIKEPKTIRLSFCIPTLNRGTFIGATLACIISQATDEVEIVIVDGGSTDNTEEVVREYQLRFPRLRYVRESFQKDGLNSPPPPGTGFDRDCNWAVELAQGEYCWLMTDDDLLKPSAIQRVLDAIRHDYGLVIVNSEYRTPDLSKVLRAKSLPMNSDRVYKPAENQLLFTDVGNYLSFMGCVVIRRDLWVARDKEGYFGSLFIHVGVIFQSPLPKDTLVIAEPLISIRYGNALWKPRRFEIWIFKWPDLIWSFSGYSEAAKSQVYPREPWRSIKFLLYLRAQGAFSQTEYHRLEPYLRSKRARLTAKLISHLPPSMLNLLGVIYCSFIHPKSGVALMDLVHSPYYIRNRLKQFYGWFQTKPAKG